MNIKSFQYVWVFVMLLCLSPLYAQIPAAVNHPFGDNNKTKTSKTFTPPQLTKNKNIHHSKADVLISIDYSSRLNPVSKYIYGINATTYTGNYLNDKKLMKHLQQLNPQIIRFPGGDASNMYFFNHLPDDLPEKALTYNGAWTDFTDGSKEVNWKIHTKEYYALLDSVQAEGFITVNYAYARYGTSENPVARAASLAADWVRHDNGRTKFWEIGNETYACWEGGFRIDTSLNKDGQPEYINGQLYGRHFKVFADSMRKAAAEQGNEIYIGAVFADDDEVWDGSGKGITRNWNNLLAKELRKKDGSNYADFISTHSYFLNKNEKTPAEIIHSYQVVNELQQYIHKKLEKAQLDQVPLALTEWNIKEPHQTTQVGGLQALSTLGRLQEKGFGAACYFAIKDYWRKEKGDFGMFSHNDPAVPQSEPYPSFYHFYYYNQVIGDKMIATHIDNTRDSLLCFASSYQDGGIGLMLVNPTQKTLSAEFDITGFQEGKNYYWYEISKSEDGDIWSEKIAINGISHPQNAKGGPSSSFSEIPAWRHPTQNGIQLQVKGLSAVYILIEGK
mgnify:CR=1 FL=1